MVFSPRLKYLLCTCTMLLLCFFSIGVKAQLAVDTSRSAEQLVKGVFAGACVKIENVKFTGAPGSIGYFNGRNTNIGIDEGIIFSTGSVLTARGPNTDSGRSTMNFYPGDSQLTRLAHTRNTYDAAVLEFDFESDNDTVYFRYVFASEEFSEYVGKNYNDLFAFFVSGPGISGSKNVALIPNTNIPVSINNVNHKTNSKYYVGNQGGMSIEYDGFTVVLEAKVHVQPCVIYHMKLAVADAADYAYDSGVFLEARSFGGKRIQVVRKQNATEGCSDGIVSFVRPKPYDQDVKVSYTVSGTAVPGKDFKKTSGYITIPKGEGFADLNIKAFADTLSEGAEKIVIKVKDDCHCTGSSSDSIYIFENPFPATLLKERKVKLCRGDSVQLKGYPGVKYKWSPPDGLSGDSLKDPFAFPSSTAMYKLTVWNEEGCSATDSVYVTVFESPVVDFRNDPVCAGDMVKFENMTTLAAGKVVSWNWDFGDGTFSAKAAPEHRYFLPGAYDVVLTAVSDKGCTRKLKKRLSVLPVPLASFEAPALCERQKYTLKNTSTLKWGKMGGYYWDLGNGKTSTAAEPAVRYEKAGTYTITLIAHSEGGCYDTVVQEVKVAPSPVTNFYFQSSCADTSVQFWSQYSYPTDGKPVYHWDFGDGTYSDKKHPLHQYKGPGKYTVKLVTSVPSGCSDTMVKYLNLYGKPDADYKWEVSCEDTLIRFTDKTSFWLVQSGLYHWDFGDGTYSTHQDPVHKYKDPGNYLVRMRVTSLGGCVDSVSYNIEIGKPVPADFTWQQECSGYVVQFMDIITKNEEITSVMWDFGDGEFSQERGPAHVYPKEGVYTADLVITTTSGCITHVRKQIKVQKPLKPAFTAEKKCDHHTFRFTPDFASGFDLKDAVWDFGDGTYSNLPAPEHTYADEGTYHVQLSLVTTDDCAASVTVPVIVKPVPEMTINVKGGCFEDSAWTFEGSSLNSEEEITAWQWEFGDGAIAKGEKVVHQYAGPGEYKVQLKATIKAGCTLKAEQVITDLGSPRIAIQYSRSVCQGEEVVFRNQTGVLQNGTEHLWDFGDGVTANGRFASHTYKEPGVYTVTLYCKYGESCSYQWMGEVQVSPVIETLPLKVQPVCLGDITYLKLESADGGALPEVRWKLGDGHEMEGNPVYYRYEKEGVYSIEAVTPYNGKCRTVTKGQAVVKKKPEAVFDLMGGDAELGGSIRLGERSRGADSHLFMVNGNKISSSPLYYEFRDTGSYEIKLISTNTSGCSDTAVRRLYIQPDIRLYIPDAFTPDGDGLNDEWLSRGIGVAAYRSIIWNRWGEIIFSSDKMEQGWTGEVLGSGKQAMSGIYYYYVTIKDMKGKEYTYSGSILLSR